MRKLLMTAALLLAVSCPALAGVIHTPGSPSPTPTPTPTSTVQEPVDNAKLNGEMATPGLPDSLMEVALDLLAVLPSLL